MFEEHLHGVRVPSTAGGAQRGKLVGLETAHKALGIAMVGTQVGRRTVHAV
jgi:hypothetical protein